MKKVLLLLLIVSIISCKSENEIEKIDIEEVTNLGFALQNRVQENNIRGINELYDLKTFVNLFLMKSTKKKVHEFNVGFVSGFVKQFNFGELIIEQKNEGSYEFIRAYEDKNNEFHLLFRVFNQGINYHNYLVKNINGELKIIDMYSYMSGENLSETYKTYYKSILYGSNLFNNDIGELNIYKDVEKLNTIRDLNAEGNFKKSHEIYKTISSSSKTFKSFKLVNILTSSYLSDELYLEAISDYEQKFPNDPSLYLISLDGLILKKEFDKTLNYIDKLDKAIGGDPFLNFLRGNIYYFKKDYDSALGKFAITSLEYPEFIDAYESSLMIYLERDQRDKIIEILDVYNVDFKIDKAELIQNMTAISPSFINTKEFKTWFSKI